MRRTKAAPAALFPGALLGTNLLAETAKESLRSSMDKVKSLVDLGEYVEPVLPKNLGDLLPHYPQ